MKIGWARWTNVTSVHWESQRVGMAAALLFQLNFVYQEAIKAHWKCILFISLLNSISTFLNMKFSVEINMESVEGQKGSEKNRNEYCNALGIGIFFSTEKREKMWIGRMNRLYWCNNRFDWDWSLAICFTQFAREYHLHTKMHAHQL